MPFLHHRLGQLQASSALLFVLFGALPLGLLPPPPVVHSSLEVVTTYYQAYGTIFRLATYLGILSIVFFLWFLSYLCSVLERINTGASYLPRLAFGAGCIWATIFLIFSGLLQSFPALAAEAASRPLLHQLADLTDLGYATSFMPGGVMIGVSSLIILRSVRGELLRWSGWLGCFVVGAQFLASLSLVFYTGPWAAAGLFYNGAFVLFALWILLTGIFLLVKKDAAAL